MSDNLLAVKLMRGANLTKSQCEIIKASTVETDYTTIKATMKRTFGESTGIGPSNTVNSSIPHIKTEPIFQSAHQIDGGKTCNGACKNTDQRGHQSRKEEEKDDEIFYGNYSNKGKYPVKNQKETVPGTKYLQGRNPLEAQGRLTRCGICDSVNHWRNKCPDRDMFT